MASLRGAIGMMTLPAVLAAGIQAAAVTVGAGPASAQSGPVAGASPGLSPPSGPLPVVVTIKPLHALVAQVMAGVDTPTLLLDGPASPHTYALKPSDVRRLHAARAVVMIGDRLETFMPKVAASLPKTVALLRADQAQGLVRHVVREGGPFEADEHDAKGGHEHGHAHDKKPPKDRQPAGPATEPLDAHVWLDPDNARAILAHVATELGRLAPAHAATFNANASTAAARLDGLAADLARDLEAVKDKPFFVFHDAYQYFERRFGLTAAGSVTVDPDRQPGARRLKAIRAKLQGGGAACIFAEPQFEPKLVATLVEGTPVRTGLLDPLGIAVPAGPDAYATVLKGLSAGLRACLAPAS